VGVRVLIKSEIEFVSSMRLSMQDHSRCITTTKQNNPLFEMNQHCQSLKT